MDFGAFGWQGFQNRALEFPSGVTDGFEVEVSPSGRMRIRYNDLLAQGEVSVNGAPYVPFSAAGPSPSSGSTFTGDALILPDSIIAPPILVRSLLPVATYRS